VGRDEHVVSSAGTTTEIIITDSDSDYDVVIISDSD
jgi:hypothetical protein